MNKHQISADVAHYLEGASEYLITDILHHGIHNITNDFSGDYYHEYAAEFAAQAADMLDKMHNNQEAHQ